MYVYQAGEDTTRNQAAGKRIVYRVGTTKGDISGNHKDYRVTATEKVNGTKVTFKGGEKWYTSLVGQRWSKPCDVL